MKTLGFGLYPLVENLVRSRVTRWPADRRGSGCLVNADSTGFQNPKLVTEFLFLEERNEICDARQYGIGFGARSSFQNDDAAGNFWRKPQDMAEVMIECD